MCVIVLLLAVERWCEGERAFPLKKRRGSLGETPMLDVKDGGSKKMKSTKSGNTRTSKKDVRREDIDEDEDGEFEEGRGQGGGEEKKTVGAIESSSGVKKRGRGGALMEGSRCSRVNGRGWRCCQQTLVGYSLCEHHLGKGRLRSMTSVRSKSKRPNSSSSASRANELPPEDRALDSLTKAEGAEDGDEEDDDDIEEKAAVKKKVKLGMVKARSMSSLLGQASSATATATATATTTTTVDAQR